MFYKHIKLIQNFQDHHYYTIVVVYLDTIDIVIINNIITYKFFRIINLQKWMKKILWKLKYNENRI